MGYFVVHPPWIEQNNITYMQEHGNKECGQRQWRMGQPWWALMLQLSQVQALEYGHLSPQPRCGHSAAWSGCGCPHPWLSSGTPPLWIQLSWWWQTLQWWCCHWDWSTAVWSLAANVVWSKCIKAKFWRRNETVVTWCCLLTDSLAQCE